MDKDVIFNILTVGDGDYRTGRLFNMDTPICPYVCNKVTPDPLLFEEFVSKIPFLCVTYSNVLPILPILKEELHMKNDGKDIRPFLDYENSIIMLTLRDMYNNIKYKIINDKFNLYVDGNKFILDEEITLDIIKLLKPSLIILPYEELKIININNWSNRRRFRMLRLFNSYYNYLNHNNLPLIIPYHKNLPNISSKLGIDFSGFGYGESLNIRSIHIKSFLNNIHPNILRIIHLQYGTPIELLHSILLGIDVIITALPQILAKKGFALTFKIPNINQLNTHDLNTQLSQLQQLLINNHKFNNLFHSSNPNDVTDSLSPAESSPLEVHPAVSSSNSLPVNGKATPGDRGDDNEDVTSSGKPENDLREFEGEVNIEADGRNVTSGGTPTGEDSNCTLDGTPSNNVDDYSSDGTSIEQDNVKLSDNVVTSELHNAVGITDKLLSFLGSHCCKYVDDSYKDVCEYTIDLNDLKYRQDVDVLLDDESIVKESRGYINHLLVCKEMLAEVHLTRHNLWMYELLLKRARESIEEGKLLSFIIAFIKMNL